MAARWGSWRDLKALGVPRATLHGWLRRGAVRSEGPAGERKYLMRDVVERFANTKRRAETGNPLDVSRASRITESNMHKVAGDTYLSVSAVARALGLSAARVRQLDEDLAPLKLERGQRVYLKSNVDRLARQRSRDKK
jgi:DNA-binding transcriptional MerR regulator